MAGSPDDAQLLVQLAQWAATMGFDEAAGVIFADDFDADGADSNDEAVRKVLYFFETVGTLVKHDLLNRDLVFDWLWVAGAWDRVRPAALKTRAQLETAALYENFEALAEAQAG